MSKCSPASGRFDYPAGFQLRHCFWLLVLIVSSDAAYAFYEARPVIRMSDVLTPQQAQSVYHRVEDIQLDGKFYSFHVDSELCNAIISSMAMFRNRLQEITTLAQAINKFSKEDSELSEKLRPQFSIRSDSAIDIISRPVKSAANIAGQIANDLNDTFNGVPAASPEAFSYAGKELKDPGIAMYKRNIASQWGLDVYSTNPKVQEFLNIVAMARASGRISAGTPSLRSQINRPGKASDPAIEADTESLLKNKSISELQTINRTLLFDMNINSRMVEKFLQNTAFSPRHRTRIIHYLAALNSVRNRAAFIQVTNRVDNEVMAVAFDETAMMLKYYNDTITPLDKLYVGNDVLEAVSRARHIIYFVPIDIIYWSEQTEKLFDSLQRRAGMSGYIAWELVTAGTVTEEAARQLHQRKFILRDRFVNK